MVLKVGTDILPQIISLDRLGHILWLEFLCSTATAYAGERDEDKQDYESRRHKGYCFSFFFLELTFLF